MHCSVAFRLQCQVEGTLVFCISAKLHVAVFNIKRLLMALKLSLRLHNLQQLTWKQRFMMTMLQQQIFHEYIVYYFGYILLNKRNYPLYHCRWEHWLVIRSRIAVIWMCYGILYVDGWVAESGANTWAAEGLQRATRCIYESKTFQELQDLLHSEVSCQCTAPCCKHCHHLSDSVLTSSFVVSFHSRSLLAAMWMAIPWFFTSPGFFPPLSLFLSHNTHSLSLALEFAVNLTSLL